MRELSEKMGQIDGHKDRQMTRRVYLMEKSAAIKSTLENIVLYYGRDREEREGSITRK